MHGCHLQNFHSPADVATIKARAEKAKRSEAAKAEALVAAQTARRRAAIPIIEAENAALKKARDLHMVSAPRRAFTPLEGEGSTSKQIQNPVLPRK